MSNFIDFLILLDYNIDKSNGGIKMIGDKIRERRLELGMTQLEIAELTGIKKNTISNYENNVSAPNENNIFKLMEVLKCDANYLFEWDRVEELRLTLSEKAFIKKYRTLDEYGKKAVDNLLDNEYERCQSEKKLKVIQLPMSELKVSAGTGNWLENNLYDSIEVVDTPLSRKADLVIEISGDSMEPTYRNGDNVLVRLQPSVDIGEIGVFVKDSEGYIKELGSNCLISHNKNYTDILLNEYSDIRCVGKVIGRAEVVN